MKKILLAVTGSVAVIKIKKLKELLEQEFEVKVIASDYVLNNFNDIDKLRPIKEDKNLSTFPKHIELAKWADLILVAPASANTIAQFYAGFGSDPLKTTLLAARQKIIFVPAMNTFMYESLLERNIINNLSKMNHMFIGPVDGKLREGECGLGRMSEPEDIFKRVSSYLNKSEKPKVLISIGASKVQIDPVRFITSNATGTFGKLIANELRLNNFDVQIININNYTNESFIEKAKSLDWDIYISTGAFADYKVKASSKKIRKNEIDKINLENNIDVLTTLKHLYKKRKFIGFKYDDDEEKAKEKMKSLNLEMMIWNKIGAMGSNNIEGKIFRKNKKDIVFKNNKKEVAEIIAKEVE